MEQLCFPNPRCTEENRIGRIVARPNTEPYSYISHYTSVAIPLAGLLLFQFLLSVCTRSQWHNKYTFELNLQYLSPSTSMPRGRIELPQPLHNIQAKFELYKDLVQSGLQLRYFESHWIMYG